MIDKELSMIQKTTRPLHIALISYEYPPDTADGGIATYVGQAAQMLQQRGHQVEVFAGSREGAGSTVQNGVMAHRVKGVDRHDFADNIGPVFARRHAEQRFDVLEGPEYHADAREAVRLVPDIPLIVKLHTPSFMIMEMIYPDLSLSDKIRTYIGAKRKGKRPFWEYRREEDQEYTHTLQADEVVSPSTSLGQRMTVDWSLDAGRVVTIPYPYTPAPALLDISPDTQTNIVTYIGRLEIRKGVLDLAKAIPSILERFPHTKFRFVGRSFPSPVKGMTMKDYLSRKLARHAQAVEFISGVPLAEIPAVLAGTDVCVFPSLWENFPNVCLEAMASARGVVGSSAGGMAEMLDNGRVGSLVPPRSPEYIVSAVCDLLNNPERRKELGRAARTRIGEQYHIARIAELQEASYQRAIARRRQLGPRS